MNGKKKILIGIGAAVAALMIFVMILGGSAIGWRNRLVELEESVRRSWANVENQMQRRMDLVPNLVETVRGYADHESDVLTRVTEARASVAGAGSPQEMIDANQELTSALSRLMVVVENYPDLKANQNFIALQDELAGTENRLAVERRRYNEAVGKFNGTRRKIPYSFFAANFPQAAYFEAAPEASEVPEVSF
ncbi:LemA family protein [Chitinispirillales bacterium ANBcel5]|uniref:LemA family protein n=1 Tax=Cellulosispirillum alkaliphilum TaxID=3039283 RepID=UPI002A55C17C|nr:LemA family protein [Chitinispirillales bacterium ANBcel5]